MNMDRYIESIMLLALEQSFFNFTCSAREVDKMVNHAFNNPSRYSLFSIANAALTYETLLPRTITTIYERYDGGWRETLVSRIANHHSTSQTLKFTMDLEQ